MTARPIIITGVDGFVGRHLAHAAALAGAPVVGISRTAHPPAALLDLLDGYVQADLRQGWPIELPPDAVVIHLAGLAAVGASFDAPQHYLNAASAMVTLLGESLLAQERLDVRVLGVSTGAVYAHSAGPRSETDPIAYTSPYIVSKVLV